MIERYSRRRGLVFVLPTLIGNFRNVIFNATAHLLLEVSTDVVPLTAYCEHQTCLRASHHTYRYYLVDGAECPAPYFDPLIIVGGDRTVTNGVEPNYATRCAEHHVLPAKDYTYLELHGLGESASRGDVAPLERELSALSRSPAESILSTYLPDGDLERERIARNTLSVPFLAERALCYLYAEQNVISEGVFTAHGSPFGSQR